jgi:hypothetical protein
MVTKSLSVRNYTNKRLSIIGLADQDWLKNIGLIFGNVGKETGAFCAPDFKKEVEHDA